jgi:hypothetical protein
MYERGVPEQGTVAVPVCERRARERRRIARRPSRGPRPVRPAVSAVAVRPAEAERPPVPRSAAGRVPLPVPALRTLARARAVPRVAAVSVRVRRALAGVGVFLASAAFVVVLGVLADSSSAVRVGEDVVRAPQSTVVVTVDAERTAWDVARRLVPGASGPEVAAVAEQIVTDNSLGSVPLRPGQVLRVTFG